MTSIKANAADIIWNYAGTIVSMVSGFVLLPLLMHFLTPDELGFWYVLIAVSNFAMLFEFGFTPTFARNIVYVVSGARKLTPKGLNSEYVKDGIDWGLLSTVIRASRIIYALIAFVVTLLLITLGTLYVKSVALRSPSLNWQGPWAIFCIAVFINLYFLYTITCLRGFGDIAGENRAKTIAKLLQLLISGILLAFGLGLLGASIGFLANGLFLRLFASFEQKKHTELLCGIRSCADTHSVKRTLDVLFTVGHLAWKDGLVMLSNYASTQAMSLVGSFTLGLAETGTYSVLMQFGTAIYQFAGAYPSSFFPSFQSAHAAGDVERQRMIVAKTMSCYIALMIFGLIGVSVVALPILPYIKSGFNPDVILFVAIGLYLGLWNQHSICCSFIIAMNEIPYMVGFIVAAVMGTIFSCVFSGLLGWGAWGLVAGQAISQAMFNNWRWPGYLAAKLNTRYVHLVKIGFIEWSAALKAKI